MVVWGHFSLMENICYKIYNPYTIIISDLKLYWEAFFMPAFFIISGYCSSFNKPLKHFILSRIKTILLPTLIVGVITQIESCLSIYFQGFESIYWCIKTIIKSVILTIGNEWFLPTLFIGSIGVCFISQKKINKKVALSLLFILFLLGLYLYNNVKSLYNIWFFKHALMATIFIYIGDCLKSIQWQYWSMGKALLIYPLLIGCIIGFGIHIPYLTNGVHITFQEIPLFLLLALTGSLFIVFTSKFIYEHLSMKNPIIKILLFLGKNSIVVYLFHFALYRILIYYINPLFIQGKIHSLFFFIIVIILNISICSIIAKLLNTKRLKWIIGKF